MDAAGQNSSLRNETPACMLNSSASKITSV